MALTPQLIGTASAVPKAQTMKWVGPLMTSFQIMGSLHFSMSLEGYPDQGDTNVFLDIMKGRKIRVTVEALDG